MSQPPSPAGQRRIGTLAAADVATLVGWAAVEGWNPGLDDAAPFRAADAEGFIGAWLGEQLVAGMSAVRYGADFGFIGLYICHPGFRGQGHGRAVWDAGMARLAGRTAGLDGVEAQQANYASMGFAPAYETVRWGGPALPAAAADIRPFGPQWRTGVETLDGQCFPAPRPAFLDLWTTAPRITAVLIAKGEVAGYGVIRACREGHKIGPLFAANAEQALALAGDLCRRAGATAIQIDVPAPQAAFTARLQAAGYSEGFRTMRMYRGPAPRIELGAVFGVTTLELG